MKKFLYKTYTFLSLTLNPISVINMLRLWLLELALFAVIVASERYVPGTPGASWTEEEMMTVKAKLYSIFNNGGGFKAMEELYGTPDNGVTFMDVPNAAKMLRLGFHDCLK